MSAAGGYELRIRTSIHTSCTPVRRFARNRLHHAKESHLFLSFIRCRSGRGRNEHALVTPDLSYDYYHSSTRESSEQGEDNKWDGKKKTIQ